jgi:hypothetical protein
VSDNVVRDKLNALKEREQQLVIQAAELKSEIDSAPSAQEIKGIAKSFSDRVMKSGRILRSATQWAKTEVINSAFNRMSWEEKRALCQMLFSGKRADGKRMGVYVMKPDRQPKVQHRPWLYAIHGHLICESGRTKSKDRLSDYFECGHLLQAELIANHSRGVSSSATSIQRRTHTRPSTAT